MPLAHFSCPHCEGLFQADTALAGTEVTCPFCSGIVTLPPADFSFEDVLEPSGGFDPVESITGTQQAEPDWASALYESPKFVQANESPPADVEAVSDDGSIARVPDGLLPPSLDEPDPTTLSMPAAASYDANLLPPEAVEAAPAVEEISLPPTVDQPAERLRVEPRNVRPPVPSGPYSDIGELADGATLAAVFAEDQPAAAAQEDFSGEQRERRRNVRSLIKFVVCFVILILAARLLALLNVQQ